MLEKLDQIDWTDLDSPNVPILLRNLMLSDRKSRNDSFKELEHYLSPWEAFELGKYQHEALLTLVKRDAIIVTIPLLFELLTDETTQDKDLLLWLLEELLRYKEPIVEANLSEQEKSKYRLYAQRIYDAVHEGTPLFKKFLKSNDPAVKESARSLLEDLEAKSSN